MIKCYCDKCGKEIEKDKFDLMFDSVWEGDTMLCKKCKNKFEKTKEKFLKGVKT